MSKSRIKNLSKITGMPFREIKVLWKEKRWRVIVRGLEALKKMSLSEFRLLLSNTPKGENAKKMIYELYSDLAFLLKRIKKIKEEEV